ncbi:aminotransferase class I/II-fold pyridoxal phosphate-dependent enzyme [Taibaiella soli]|uniref:Pyridoxal phosphate-dependent aminotransferase family protein n=1 Tax=Taibaiella soli TaxID=1649169 RepID=A0A2W2BJN6_9BACT|nr:aminotransferase class I/II-fold pyridoxal phosphate-dependent enzyme [Taibaiella soli]PZF73656.1 pyridoxal phosphate-dependent aminotransferase family protein [Taibaiella soli]
MDIFAKFEKRLGPIGDYAEKAPGYFAFPKLEGEIGNHMKFRGKECIVWSLNNYLGLANHPEVRKADAEAAAKYGMATPMGARMMSGNSDNHTELERQLAEFVGTEDAMLFNFGYQGMVSAIDSLCSRHDVVVYDAESHACIIDGLRLIPSHRYVYKHNDVEDCEKQLQRATEMVKKTGGGILVITEGVFGMSGNQGKISEIVALKSKYEFRLFVDDAHGFGTMGKTGAGIGEHQNCMKEIDVYFSTFAKSMASIGGFLAADKKVLTYLRYNMRSQVFAKSLPMPIVVGNLKRLELLKTHPELKEKLWHNVNRIQNGLRERGFNIGTTNTPVTPVHMQGGLFDATQLILDMRENYGIFCSVVVYPVVPKGTIILRIIPTAVHTDEDIDKTLEVFSLLRDKLEQKLYPQEMPQIAAEATV